MLPGIDIVQIVIVLLPLLFSVTIHEVAHGYAAFCFGDPTAKLAGRLSLNPIRHLDPIGSFLLPLILKVSGAPIIFGYAKPVPVNFANLQNKRGGALCVAAAGVAVNFAAAFACAGILQLIRPLQLHASAFAAAGQLLVQLLAYSVMINLVLGIFNLIPVPPLDGGRIVSMLLPQRLARRFQAIEPFGILVLVALLLTNSLDLFVSFFISPLLNWMLQGYL
ncbi:MAG: site-2 protease family protein [Desulfosalsimonadaceae bacterium]